MRPEQKVIQLWHAPGAFKKFGGSVENASMLKKISDNTDYLIITSKHIEDYYSEAFQIDKSKIKAFRLRLSPMCMGISGLNASCINLAISSFAANIIPSLL